MVDEAVQPSWSELTARTDVDVNAAIMTSKATKPPGDFFRSVKPDICRFVIFPLSVAPATESLLFYRQVLRKGLQDFHECSDNIRGVRFQTA
jgi:hypothetical protein